MVKLSNKQAINRVLKSSGKVIVEFQAPWCKSCPAMTERLESMEQITPTVLFCKVDADQDGAKEVSEKLGVMSVPSVLCFEGGEEKLRVTSLSQIGEVRGFLNGDSRVI